MIESGSGTNLKISPDIFVAVLVTILIAGTTAAHYLTPHSLHYLHGIYRRIYYIPIIIAAMQFGLQEALGVSALISIVYIPHAFLLETMDPGRTEEKILEIVLYFAVALVTGSMRLRLRKEIEQRKDTERMLRLSERLTSLGELSAGFAHEIRNPTASVKGAAQLLQDYFPGEDSRKKIVDLLVKEADRLEKTVGKFLGFAHPSVSRVKGLLLRDLLGDTVELLKNHRDAEGKEIRFDDDAKEARFDGDPTLLKQVFFNIGLNGLQAMEKGGVLSIVLEQQRDHWAVKFGDGGPGLDPEALERIFDPFYTTKEKGTGLGLSVSYRIVQEHGGDIRVESRKGKGSTFTVLLPRRYPRNEDRRDSSCKHLAHPTGIRDEKQGNHSDRR